jgi:hypothetical protein
MTRYIATPGNDWYRDQSQSMVIGGYDYQPATPNPDNETETYRPVTLVWVIPDNGIWHTMPVAVNGHRGNRTYKIFTPGATNTYGVMVNGVIIPVEFDTIPDAKLFAQHIEDTNTED